jgi:hypothetical protein
MNGPRIASEGKVLVRVARRRGVRLCGVFCAWCVAIHACVLKERLSGRIFVLNGCMLWMVG